MIKLTCKFRVHSNESTCRKSGDLDLEQVIYNKARCHIMYDTSEKNPSFDHKGLYVEPEVGYWFSYMLVTTVLVFVMH